MPKAAKRVLSAEQRVKRLASQQRWRDANRETVRAKGREYSREHREQSRAWDAVPEHRAHKNARTRERYQEIKATDPERIKAKSRRDYQLNPKMYAAASRRWEAANQKRVTANRTAYASKQTEISKAWAKANPERAAAKTQRWRERHPGKALQWRKENPEAFRAIKLRYRAALASAEGSHTADELKALFAQQNGQCAYCAKALTKSYAADHVVPLSRGGSNWIANIALACKSCNSRKHAMDEAEFLRRRSINQQEPPP